MIASMDKIFFQASLTIIVATGKNANSGIFVTESESFDKVRG